MRIHFTARDLALTHLADEPDPLWELVNSAQALQTRYGQVVLGQWRRQVAAGLRRADLTARVRAQLFPVAPHASYYPDLLTPPEGALGLDEGLAAILGTERSRLAGEIGRLDGAPGAGDWLADLAAGRVAALTEFEGLLRGYYQHAVAPYWDRMRAHVQRDLAMRRQVLRERGVEGLLDSFAPMLRWRRPVLEFARHPSGREIHLDGRGLRLLPSYFCQLHPLTIFDSELPQLIVYPVARDPRWLAPNPFRSDGPALARLLGDTRAAVLRATVDGCSTIELARRANTSPASASRHAAVLREAGLLTTSRVGGSVLHRATPLGVDLATGQAARGS
ncbi:MAG TPA: winged helix-turn-helix domain-containing protein [Actinophytocola sp.]|uniref:ArsR/SmtB family transcription factor n=1 Tax=Actinophytocola sp. TaxID=1872138 RepID=UPI002DBE094C|nr:winged helix-turn-helix domain-containing protein [Actinophytocola sp.]HEU5471108.1 winged helix-turn-helix domain-containing protein [Actinophytocola sp.]